MDDPLGNVNGHRGPDQAGSISGTPSLAPQPARPAGAGSVAEAVAALIDEAHASLSTRDLAALLLAVRRMTGSADGLMRAPDGALAPSPGRAVDAYLGAITGALARPEAGGDGIGGWLEAYLDEVAARPRGSALREAA
jgi:hypothetical protein